MGKKIRVLAAAMLIVSTAISYSQTSSNKTESLARKEVKAAAKNVSVLANNDLNDSAGEGYYKAAENDKLELYVKDDNLGLKIVNKFTGYVWNSTIDTKDKNLNQTWQAFAQSAVTIGYVDEKNRLSQLSMTSEEAKTKVTKTDSGFKADINFEKQGIKLSLEAVLEEDSLSVKVPYSAIEEKDSKYKIQTIVLYPFFGAVKGNDIDGYMFVPDGSGALISLNQKALASQPFIGRVYGEDIGMSGINRRSMTDNSINPDQIYMPVFGMNIDNTNGYIAYIEGGAPFAQILAYPSGVTTLFNWIAARFIYRDTYLQPTDKKGNAIMVNQKQKNKFDAKLKYMFLSNEASSYIGMAKRYQSQLVNEGILKKTRKEDDKELPVRLEFYAADNKKVFLWKKVVPMTTVDQMKSIIKDLRDNKVDNISLVINGWTKGGVTGAAPSAFPFEKKVGSASEWKSFIKNNEEMGIPTYMFANFANGYQNTKGYRKNDIAQTISEQLISFWNGINYLSPKFTEKIFNNQISKFEKYGIKNIALGFIGKNLISSYNPKNSLSRSETLSIYKEILSSNNKDKYALYQPNQYLWQYTNAYLDMPMDSSNFMLETEAVPFIQIVLKGYVDYYAPASNFYSNSVKETLKLIDYGAYPSFYLTYEDPVRLLDTGSDWLYTSQYLVWKDEIIKTYGDVNKALKQCKNADIKDRVKLKEGVYKTTYTNGVSVIVNYTDDTYSFENTAVAGESFTVIGGDK